jgi:hypothetical protein
MFQCGVALCRGHLIASEQDLHKQDREMEEDPVELVPGARLCSIRNCTYVIPPVEEYRWKMCALCRLRRREKKRQDRLNESTKISAGQMATVSIQKTIVRINCFSIVKVINMIYLFTNTE